MVCSPAPARDEEIRFNMASGVVFRLALGLLLTELLLLGSAPHALILLPVTALKRQFLPKAFFSSSGERACEVSLGSILRKALPSTQRFLRAFPSLLTKQNYLYSSE